MQRQVITARPNWQAKVEEIGLTFHTFPSGKYWDESAFYELTRAEVDALETAANTLHELCLEAAGAVIEHDWFARLGIPAAAVPAIRASWDADEFSLYGRFDFAFDGRTPPKLLEYNADTPTALIEASVAQWFWLQDSFKNLDQFNSIHERLIAAWKKFGRGPVYFSTVKDFPEDGQTVTYLQDTCAQAGLETRVIAVEDIGWNARLKRFVDLEERPIDTCFKLYPWEWLWHEEFAPQLALRTTQFIEPTWKMLLSNKGLLPILWELFPGHENLLACHERPEPLHGNFVRKPKLSREGCNVTLVERGQTVAETGGEYGAEGFVYQALAPAADFDGNHPVCGVWVIEHEAGGLGIREDTRRITGNFSRFVPHLF